MSSIAEEWRPIADCDGYEISSFVRVRGLDRIVKSSSPGHIHGRRLKGKMLKPYMSNGYLSVNLGGKAMYIHRLIAAAFIGPIPDEMQINHRDGNKLNNCITNLEIVTHQENAIHAVAMGLTPAMGRSNYSAKLTDELVIEIRQDVSLSQAAMAVKYGVTQALISRIRSGKAWKHVT